MAQKDCPLCGGTGWKTVERAAANENAQRVSLDKPGTLAQGKSNLVWAVPCDCTSSDRAERTLARARIPRRYEHCDFDNFDTDVHVEQPEASAWNRSLEQAKLIVQAFARDFPIGTEAGLLLMGRCGAGKTHLAVSALRQVVQRGHSGLFYDYRELLKEIQDSYNPVSQTTELSVLDPVLNTELLLIDDLGSSKSSDWVRETVGHILNTRYNARRITILTTNFLDQAIPSPGNDMVGPRGTDTPIDTHLKASRTRLPWGQAIAHQVEDTLSQRLDGRIRSRLYEMCRTIEIVAPDFRKDIRQAGRSR